MKASRSEAGDPPAGMSGRVSDTRRLDTGGWARIEAHAGKKNFNLEQP